MSWIRGFLMAVSMFSIIPVKINKWEEKNYGKMIVLFPFVGLLIGCIWYLAYTICAAININLMIKSVIITLIPWIFSGFIHIDGYMDTCDAIYSRASIEKKREILKDSRVGAFAVIGFVILCLLSVSAVYSIVSSGKGGEIFIIIPFISRSLSSITIFNVKESSKEGYVSSYKKEGKKSYSVILFLFILAGSLLAIFINFKIGVVALLGILIGYIWSSISSIKEFGGISGDLCGFILTISEFLAVLFIGIV